MERGLERNGPLQHSTAITQHIFVRRPPAGSSQAHPYHHSTAAPQRAALVRGADLPQVERREGHKQSILRLPASRSEAHPYHHTTQPTQSRGLGIVNVFLHVCAHVCMCAHVCAYKRKNQITHVQLYKTKHISLYIEI